MTTQYLGFAYSESSDTNFSVVYVQVNGVYNCVQLFTELRLLDPEGEGKVIFLNRVRMLLSNLTCIIDQILLGTPKFKTWEQKLDYLV